MSDFEKYGFVKQFVDNSVERTGYIAEVNGQIYTLDGYNLVTAINVNDVHFVQKSDRVIVYDNRDRVIVNISLFDIDNWMIKNYDKDMEEHVFSIRNKGVHCKILVKGFIINDVAC